MTCDEIVEDLRLTQDWFQSNLGIHPAHYAVPYGVTPLPEAAAEEVEGMILLANSGLESDRLPPRHWNRRPITGHLQGVVP
jgi:hypothetical protein